MEAAGADLFHGLVMAEERFRGEGYREGCAEGRRAGAAAGRRCGALRGAAVGAEVGCYLGFAQTWHCLLHKCTDEKNSKKIRVLNALIGMIQKFPYEDPTYDKLQEDLEKIRGKYKQEGTSSWVKRKTANGIGMNGRGTKIFDHKVEAAVAQNPNMALSLVGEADGNVRAI